MKKSIDQIRHTVALRHTASKARSPWGPAACFTFCLVPTATSPTGEHDGVYEPITSQLTQQFAAQKVDPAEKVSLELNICLT